MIKVKCEVNTYDHIGQTTGAFIEVEDHEGHDATFNSTVRISIDGKTHVVVNAKDMITAIENCVRVHR